MSHFDIHTSAFYSFGCYPMQRCTAIRAGTADIQDLVTNASELAPVIQTFLHTPGERP